MECRREVDGDVGGVLTSDNRESRIVNHESRIKQERDSNRATSEPRSVTSD